MSIASDVKIYLAAKLSTLGTVYLDNFGAEESSVMIRSDPSQVVETEFIDGSTTGIQFLSIYARNKNPADAISKLETILDTLDQPEISLTDLVCVKVMPQTSPHLISKDDAGVNIYSCAVKVSYDSDNAKE